MIYLRDRFNFGKYRGMRVEDVADMDPGYIHWCAANTGHKFSGGVYIQVQRAHNRSPSYKAGGAFIRG